jgi:protein TonB
MKAKIMFFAVLTAFSANVLAASPAIGTTDPTFVEGPTPPKYPASAIKEKHSGTVRVEVSIDKAGQVSAVELAQTSGSAVLDAVAIERAWNWKFKPATENGEPVESRVRVPVIFSLDGAPGESSESAEPATAADPDTSAE